MWRLLMLTGWAMAAATPYIPGNEHAGHNVNMDSANPAASRSQIDSDKKHDDWDAQRASVPGNTHADSVIDVKPCAEKVVIRENDKIIHEVILPPREGCPGYVKTRQMQNVGQNQDQKPGVHQGAMQQQQQFQQSRNQEPPVNPHQGNQIVQPVPIQPQHIPQAPHPLPLSPQPQYYYPQIQKPQMYRPPAPVYEVYTPQKPIQTIYSSPAMYPVYPTIEEHYNEVQTGYPPHLTHCHAQIYQPNTRSAKYSQMSVPYGW